MYVNIFRIDHGTTRDSTTRDVPDDKKGKDAGGGSIALLRERTLLSNLTPEMIVTSTSNFQAFAPLHITYNSDIFLFAIDCVCVVCAYTCLCVASTFKDTHREHKLVYKQKYRII